MKKNQKVKLQGSSVQGTDGAFYSLLKLHRNSMLEYLTTVTTVSSSPSVSPSVTPGGASRYWNTINNVPIHNDCYWFRKEAFFDLCTKDDEHCIGMKKCKFYETEFQHQVRVTIEKAEKDE